MKRKATAIWNGSGKEGKGTMSTQSGVLNQTPYSFNTRFTEIDEKGTNPEELVAAAHSGCFTMKLSFNLGAKGFEPTELKTNCTIVLEEGVITASNLELDATVAGISKESFEEAVRDAEANCPISKLLNTKINVTYTLNGA
jgi:osmotically inducible protein OsmC